MVDGSQHSQLQHLLPPPQSSTTTTTGVPPKSVGGVAPTDFGNINCVITNEEDMMAIFQRNSSLTPETFQIASYNDYNVVNKLGVASKVTATIAGGVNGGKGKHAACSVYDFKIKSVSFEERKIYLVTTCKVMKKDESNLTVRPERQESQL